MKNPALIKNNIPENSCSLDMDEKIIALAAGEINKYEERISILIHILSCECCRLLFEDSILLQQIDEDNYSIGSLPLIQLKIKGSRVIPSTTSASHTDRAPLLSIEGDESAEFRINHNNEEITLRVLRAEDGVDFDLSANDKEAKFYLIGGDGFNTAFQYNSIARFENIKPGKYALTINLKEFIFIDITED